jgi:hypothetical protein
LALDGRVNLDVFGFAVITNADGADGSLALGLELDVRSGAGCGARLEGDLGKCGGNGEFGNFRLRSFGMESGRC